MSGPAGTSPASPVLSRVARGDLCAGCGGCALVAPDAVQMELAAPGYLRPRQTAPISADQDRMIAAICPGLRQDVDAAGRIDDPLWGPYLHMHSGYATDAGLRHHGSSGGVLSALLAYLLHTGAIDGAIQTGPDPDVAVANMPVITIDRAGVERAAGSRYAPSAPLADLASVLNGTGRYAFVGKPCDVAALRALAARDPRVDARLPYKLSFFCAGVPSRTGAEKVLEKLGTSPDRAASFRYRGQGWPGFATAVDHDGTERQMSYHESWGGVLSRHVQHRCKICADGTGAAADLVCADAWETDKKGYPLFDDKDGISLVVARTATGAALLRDAETDGAVIVAPYDAAALAAIQPGQTNRRRSLLARLSALVLLGRPVPRYRGLKIAAAARQNRPGANLKNFLGMLRRGVSKQS